MPFNLMSVFKNADFQKFDQTASNLISLACTTSKKNGAKIVRAVFDNGATLTKTVTASGVIIEEADIIPAITSVVQRNEIIRDLSRNKKTQEQIAAMLDISQATVSNVLRKGK